MQGRLWFVFGVICVLFVGLIARLMYIQYTDGETYEKQVLAQMSYDSRVIPYQRGDITDTNGTVLATSVDVYNLILDCYVLNQNEDKIDSTIHQITSLYPEISEEEIRGYLTNQPNNQYVTLVKQMSYKDMEKLQDVMNDEETGSQVAGVWFEQEYIRQYPYGSLAASTIGFASADGNGAIGLENGYNETLNGINGRSYGYLNEDQNLERTVIEPENGHTLVTTLDINIQSIVEQEIAAFNERLAAEANNEMDGSKNTAVLVMNPKTGAVLAMADYPTFDLSDPRNLEHLYSPEELESMDAQAQLDALNELWQNFTITHTYEPGSTFKPFTVACGLETGTLTGDETFVCDGVEEIADYEIHCVVRTGHGTETVEGALMDSCNDALMQMSYRIGGENFYQYQQLFGVGQKTNIDLTGEASTGNLVYNEEELSHTINLATNSFGQNFNVTMIQMASMFCSLINGGKLNQPYVVGSIVDDAGNVVEETSTVVQKETVSQETSDILRGYLRNVVLEGTGGVAAVPGYDIGGKTGTAEKLPRGQGNYLVSFIGFAPVEDPQLLIYVVIDEPNVADQAHSNYAQEIAHNILAQILPYMNIDATEPIPEDAEDAALPEGTEAADDTAEAVPEEEGSAEQAAGTAPEETAPVEEQPAGEEPAAE